MQSGWRAGLLATALVLWAASSGWAWPGTVVRVQDGDSVLVAPAGAQKDITVRLYGIDAPELHQQGGRAAHRALQALLPVGRNVDVEEMDTDRYNRVVGLVTTEGTTVNKALLQQGQAWYNSRFCKARFCREWKKVAQNAKKEKAGLWARPNPEAPWNWRKRNPQNGR